MQASNRHSLPAFALHGYQPILIDEESLSDADCWEALRDPMNSSCDWQAYLTPDELASFEKELMAIEGRKSPLVFSNGEWPPTQEKRFEMARLGTLRAYARNKYANGLSIWYGDGTPFSH